VETPYGASRLIQCETVEFFLPGRDGDADTSDDASSVGTVSLPLPPKLIALLAALRHGNCDTTKLAEGQWTVCNDGFSLLEREKPVVAMALRMTPDEDPVAKAQRSAAAAREEIDLPVEDTDCGLFLCSTYLENERDPEREAHLLSLSDRERRRLEARLEAWEEQEVMRELEEARAANTALHERLAVIAAHERELASAEASKRREQETVAQVSPDSLREVDSDQSASPLPR
jgi:hypothetical protein